MRVLAFHQYCGMPDQAKSQRMYSFCAGLRDRGHEVVLVTGEYARHSSFFEGDRDGLVARGKVEGIDVVSIREGYRASRGVFGRVMSFINYLVIASYVWLGSKRPDIVFASSTPLSIVIPALIASVCTAAHFIFEVRDVWPDAPIQLGKLKNPLLITLARLIERRAYSSAVAVIGVSRGICDRIRGRIGGKAELVYIPNAVDQLFPKDVVASEASNNRLTVVYAGSCGYNNAIESVFGLIDKVSSDTELCDRVLFRIIGDGPALQPFKSRASERVEILGRIPKMELLEIVGSADVAIIPQRKVKNGDIKKDSLPNKFFDYLGAGLPILAGIIPEGEMAQLINSCGCGLLSEPENSGTMLENLRTLVRDPDLRKSMRTAALTLASSFLRADTVGVFVGLMERYSGGKAPKDGAS